MKPMTELLELPIIIDQIKGFSATQIGKKLLEDTSFIPEELLTTKLKEVDESLQILIRFGPFPVTQSFDLTQTFARLLKQSVLTIEEASAIALDLKTSEKIHDFFKTLKGTFPTIKSLIDQLPTLPALKQEIDSIVSPQLTIKDEASSTLLTIRRQLKTIDQKMLLLIQQALVTYSSYLTEPLYTLRNGHYVLPVSSSQKNFVSGIFHDVSSTGLTTYIEPKSVVEMASKKQSLLVEEQEEIYRILQVLTTRVLQDITSLQTINQSIGYLDMIQSKATFGKVKTGCVGTVASRPLIELFGARHPLIDEKVVISNDFYLDEQKSIIIISGPNAGGKTVAMKTVGLFVYLHQLAIPLPTSKPAQLSYFKHIYADIGDSQSVLENLSTFAGHIQNLVPLTDQVKPNDLVLIDELGTGTDPKEGESLARSLLIHLQAKRAFVIVSSHFPGLKTLAIEEPRMMNASLQFDEEKLAPTYRFVMGLPGKSYGLIMAKRYGLAPQVVAHAEKYLAQHHQGQEQALLQKLQHELSEVHQEKETLITERKKLLDNEKGLELVRQQLLKEKENYQKKLLNLEDEILDETRQKVDEVIKALANPHLKLHQAIALKESLKGEEILDDSFEETTTLSIGDYVINQETGIRGRITNIQKKNVTFVSSDGLTINAKLTQLEKMDAPSVQKKSLVSKVVKHHVRAPSSIDIIGMRYEEAKQVIDKYYDDALLSGLKTLKIIHGFGTGTLKKLVHDYFKNLSTVKAIQVGEGEQSGYGVTVVILK